MTKRKLFLITILLIGIHSLVLGIFIYFNTNLFYRFFFNTEIVDLFFVKQSGLFLFLSGLFYLVPLWNIKKMSDVSVVTIISKISAVLFLISNANLTPDPQIIYIAAISDGLMALVLTVTYLMYRKDLSSV